MNEITPSWTPLTGLTDGSLSKERLKEIVSILETMTPSSNCALLPVSDLLAASEAMAEIQARATSTDAAAEAARRIVGVYRKSDVNDPEVFSSALVAIFSDYPASVSAKVSHPVQGIPARSKFLPSVSEVKEACEVEAKRLRNLAAAARWQLNEHERRDKAARERAEFKPADPAKVDEIMARFKIQTEERV